MLGFDRPMSDLEEALEYWANLADMDADDYLVPIIDAARRQLNLTSPETIEKGIDAVIDDRALGDLVVGSPEYEEIKADVVAILEAVQE